MNSSSNTASLMVFPSCVVTGASGAPFLFRFAITVHEVDLL